MANFAEIDANNLVIRVVVVPNDQADNGQDYLANVIGLGGTWIQTSYNTIAGQHTLGGTPLRGNYAGIGFTYLPIEDIFMPPKCHETATLDAKAAKWICEDPSHKELLNANN